ncbi:MAG TPA: exodeoxyribonuclease VII small subunit [Candidatus Aphodomonas merdavium]|nr:exodeoxyribonuclease VII small subunit [Candidatus Aphodomonas merdavium]
MAAKKKLDFETGLKELEALVERMEGEMTLEESLKAYESGMKLHGQLLALLDAGEKKLKILSEDGKDV